MAVFALRMAYLHEVKNKNTINGLFIIGRYLCVKEVNFFLYLLHEYIASFSHLLFMTRILHVSLM